MNKNVLICSYAMVIGGVETVICNQIAALKKKGYNVYVLADNGIYVNKIKELGANYIEFKFPEENEFNEERIKKVISIIKQHNISQIHIHKYQCILSVMPAALITKVPYIAYIHERKSSLGYYTWHYPIYNEAFEMYFKNAYKIIAITENSINNTKKTYNIEEDKYMVVHNGIDFDTYKNDSVNYNNEINKFLILTRLGEEKVKSIQNGIDLFDEYVRKNKNNPNIKLDIIGDGPVKNKIEKYIEQKESKERIQLLGERTNIEKIIPNYDILLGLGRCILEAMAMKVPAVILGCENLKGIIEPANFDLAIQENLTGDNMEDLTIEECINQIENIKNNNKKIVDDLYNIAIKKLDSNKNYFFLNDDNYDEKKYEFDWMNMFKIIQNSSYELVNKNKEIENKIRESKGNAELLKKKEEEIKKYKEIINKQEERIYALQKEINDIYNSKRWRYSDKISNIFHMKK